MAVDGVSSGPQWAHWSDRRRGERPGDDPDRLEIWGYAGRPSYAPGEELTLHVSTTAASFDVLIYRDGGEREVVHRATDLPGALQPTPADAYASGCGWRASFSVEIPASWRSGGYVVELVASDGRGTATQDGFFVVRPEQPGREQPLALVLATYTWQAYNDWGGASAYSRDPAPESDVDADPTGASQRSAEGFSPRLSFDRPWGRGLIRLPPSAPRVALKQAPPIGWPPRREQGEWAFANGYSYWSGSAGWAGFDGLFARWAEQNGFPFEVLSQWDLDRDPGCLEHYAGVVTVGHDEYWSAGGRKALDEFIEGGGRYARLAGNVFWQVRLEGDGMTQVCHKYVPETDPLADVEDRARRTGAFESRAIGDPPVTTFGANGARGSYSRMGGSSPRGVGGFIVYRNDHWAFDGTDLYYADVLGRDVPLVGYEADGVSYTFERGLPLPTGEDGAPPGLQILALTPGSLQEEDHDVPGGFVEVGDGDLRFVARAIRGSEELDDLAAVRGGAAVITWMRKGSGEVFCGGSTEWPYALALGEPMVQRIVRNVLSRYSAR